MLWEARRGGASWILECTNARVGMDMMDRSRPGKLSMKNARTNGLVARG